MKIGSVVQTEMLFEYPSILALMAFCSEEQNG